MLLSISFQGTREHLLALSINGIILAIFGGQPLVMLGLTLPLIFFDKVIYEVSQKFELDFLPFRMWIGMWTTVFLFLFLAFGISVYIRYLTRFTLEVFLLLIAFCVVFSASSMVKSVETRHPVFSPYFRQHSCVCLKYIKETINKTQAFGPSPIGKISSNHLIGPELITRETVQHLNVSLHECEVNNGVLVGGGCDSGVYFLSLLLTFCTLLLASVIAYLRLSGFLPRSVSRKMPIVFYNTL